MTRATTASGETSGRRPWRRGVIGALLGALLMLGSGCAPRLAREMVVTGYCGCSECASWERGSWWYLKLNFWNRYVSAGPDKGRPYTGRTASGTKPHQPRPGLVSVDTLVHPWMLPIRLVFPWLWFARDGTIAADTRHYPFGTRMLVPGYGYGIVEDRGGAIKGPQRLDVYFDSHDDARQFGRRRVEVEMWR